MALFSALIFNVDGSSVYPGQGELFSLYILCTRVVLAILGPYSLLIIFSCASRSRAVQQQVTMHGLLKNLALVEVRIPRISV